MPGLDPGIHGFLSGCLGAPVGGRTPKMTPELIVASRMVDGKTVRTRPICAHPGVARYRGTGNIDDAASFTCSMQ